MNSAITLRQLNPHEPAHITAMSEIWNATCPSDLALAPRLIEFNLSPITGGQPQGQLAILPDQTIVGFVVASTLQGQPQVASPTAGWIDAIAVAPDYQRRGVGTALLTWAESWLAAQSCQLLTIGASQHPFAPGIPSALDTKRFFMQRGYGNAHQTWDVAANLSGYQPPATVRPIDAIVRPAQVSDTEALNIFLAREFPGRWHFEFQEFLRHPDHRLSDYMVLWSERGVDGFCQLTFEDSLRPIERFFPYQLPRRWGQLGPIGVSEDRRGRGYGAALLDTGLRRLYNNGVNGCVIDWTTHLALYGKFGFTPYHEYIQLKKQL